MKPLRVYAEIEKNLEEGLILCFEQIRDQEERISELLAEGAKQKKALMEMNEQARTAYLFYKQEKEHLLKNWKRNRLDFIILVFLAFGLGLAIANLLGETLWLK